MWNNHPEGIMDLFLYDRLTDHPKDVIVLETLNKQEKIRPENIYTKHWYR